MMDDEYRGVRHRKKQADPTCCPVCGITVRAHEMEQHWMLEMDRLNKLSVQKYRNKLQPKDNMSSPMASGHSSATSVASIASVSSDAKDCWNTFQRIKNNRSARLKVNTIFFLIFAFFRI